MRDRGGSRTYCFSEWLLGTVSHGPPRKVHAVREPEPLVGLSLAWFSHGVAPYLNRAPDQMSRSHAPLECSTLSFLNSSNLRRDI